MASAVQRVGRASSRSVTATSSSQMRSCRATLRSVPPPSSARGLPVESRPARIAQRSRVVSHSCPPLQQKVGRLGWGMYSGHQNGPTYPPRRPLFEKRPQLVFRQPAARLVVRRDDQALRVASPYASDFDVDHLARQALGESAAPESGFASASTSSSHADRMEESITGTVRLRICVHAAPSQEGLQLKVVGGRKALGNWDPMKATDLNCSSDGMWVADVTVPPGPLKFKVIAQTPAGRVYAEKGIRKLEVPSDNIARVLSGCYFNAHCVWGSPGEVSVQAVRLTPAERQAEIEDAELQVAKLRERQARLKAKMQDISGEIQSTNTIITTINSDVKQTLAEAITARRKAQTAAAGGSDGRPAATTTHAPASQATELDGSMDSLFHHPLWSGTGSPAESDLRAVSSSTEETSPAQTQADASQPQVEEPPNLRDILRQVEGPALVIAAIAISAAQAAGQVWKGLRNHPKAESYAAVASAAIFASIAL